MSPDNTPTPAQHSLNEYLDEQDSIALDKETSKIWFIVNICLAFTSIAIISSIAILIILIILN